MSIDDSPNTTLCSNPWQAQSTASPADESHLGKLGSIALGPILGVCALDDSLHIHGLSVNLQLSQWGFRLAWL